MSEEKKVRSIEEVKGDFMQLCARAGDLQYKAKCIADDLDMINKELRKLSFEAVDIQNEAAKKAAEAPAPVAEEVKKDG